MVDLAAVQEKSRNMGFRWLNRVGELCLCASWRSNLSGRMAQFALSADCRIPSFDWTSVSWNDCMRHQAVAMTYSSEEHWTYKQTVCTLHIYSLSRRLAESPSSQHRMKYRLQSKYLACVRTTYERSAPVWLSHMPPLYVHMDLLENSGHFKPT